MGDPVVLAAVDVGTNSVHMVVAEVDSRGFSVLTSEKEIVRLGEGARGLDHLTEPAMERGIEALRHMKHLADVRGAVMVTVATSAVREADNRHEFIRRAWKELGLEVEVISGSEEARLIFQGVSRSLNLSGASVVTVDIGGGSTEFCLGVRGKLRVTQSLKIGAVRMTDSYLPGGEVTEEDLARLRAKVKSTIAPLAHDLRVAGFDRLVLSSGTSETIARIISNARGGPEPVNLNGFAFTREELDDVVHMLTSARTPKERQTIEGLEPKRADIIVAGAVILQEIVGQLRANRFEYSEAALREGVLIDAARRMGILTDDGLDPGLESAIRLAERCSVDLDHGRHVAELASQILRGIGRSFEVSKMLDRQLRASAILAKCGNAVSYSRHHLHSHYIISNSDMTGFTHDEIENIALVARYHRKAEPKLSHGEFARLPDMRRHDVELMAGILRIATGLDRSHDQCVREVSVSNRNSVLTLTAHHGSTVDDNVELNVRTSQNRSEMLAAFLGEPIVVKAEDSSRG